MNPQELKIIQLYPSFQNRRRTCVEKIFKVSTETTITDVIETFQKKFEVGTSSSGAQIVAAITDQILDGGTTVVVGNVVGCTLVATTESTTTAPVSAQYTASERTIYCNITNTVDATTAGSFTFIIEYVPIAALS